MNATTRLAVLLSDYGFKVEGNRIIQKGIRGFTSDRIMGTCRSVFDAAEQLVPIVKNPEFTDRFIRATTPFDSVK